MIVIEESKKNTNPKTYVFLRSQKKVLAKVHFSPFPPLSHDTGGKKQK